MTVQWTISHPDRLVVATASGTLEARDIVNYLEGVAAGGAMPYRKIFDIAPATAMGLTEDDALSLSARIRAYRLVGPLGALAIVAANEHSRRMANLFMSLAQSDRPIRIFRKHGDARRWLDEAERPA